MNCFVHMKINTNNTNESVPVDVGGTKSNLWRETKQLKQSLVREL